MKISIPHAHCELAVSSLAYTAWKQAVEVYGRKWARVAEAVPSRNQVQVRERWVNVLDPDLKRGKRWTPEEDAILVEALNDCKNADGSIRSPLGFFSFSSTHIALHHCCV